MARTITSDRATCPPLPKVQPTDSAIVSAEGHVESLAILQRLHAKRTAQVSEVVAFARKLSSFRDDLLAEIALIERLYPEIQAAQHAAEDTVVQLRRSRIHRVRVPDAQGATA